MPLFFDFVDKYYILPFQANAGYNFVNTITYAVIALLLLAAIYKALQKLKIEIDFKFFLALLPFIVLGSSMRAFVDHKFFDYAFWTVSPGIYLLIAGIWLLAFGISVLIEKFLKIKYWKTCFLIGAFAAVSCWLIVASKLQFQNLKFGLLIIGLALLFSTVLYLFFKKFKPMFAEKTNFLPFPAHLLDASATFVAVDLLGFSEQHPLPTIATSLVGTAAVMYLLKLAVLIPAVYLINKETKDRNFANFLLIAITTLGLAQGLRDLLTVVLV